jgi:uncharacterized surface protein with fasciclin (FAS1) repeats
MRSKLFAFPLFALIAATTALPAYARAADESAEATVAEAEAATGAMVESWTIVQNATKSPEHTTLTQAIVAAGLAETLSGAGPFTVFAPTDQAFAAVPQSMTAYLMDPGNKAALAQVLTYHVVPGQITSADLFAKIKAGGGKATLTTVEGEPLTLTEVSGNIKVDGTQGSSGYVTKADVAQSNGVIHILNGVLIPTLAPATTAAPVDASAPAAADAAAETPATDPTN